MNTTAKPEKPRARRSRAAPPDVTVRLPGRVLGFTFEEARALFGTPVEQLTVAQAPTAQVLPFVAPVIPIPPPPLHVQQTPGLLALIGRVLNRQYAGSHKNRHMYVSARSFEGPVEVYLRLRQGNAQVFNISACTDNGRTDDELFQAKAGIGPALLAVAMYTDSGVNSIALYSLRYLAGWLHTAGDQKDLKLKGTSTSAHYLEGAHENVPPEGVEFYSYGQELYARCAELTQAA